MSYLLEDMEKWASEPKRDRAAEEAELDQRYADLQSRGKNLRKSQLRALGVQGFGLTGLSVGATLGTTPRPEKHNQYIKAGLLASAVPLAVGTGLRVRANKKVRRLNDASAQYSQDLFDYINKNEEEDYWENMRKNIQKVKDEELRSR